MTTRRSRILVLAAASVVVLVAVVAVTVVVRSAPAWRQVGDEDASDRMEQALDRLECQAAHGRTPVSELTPFNWDRLHTFDTGSTGEAIQRRSGQRVVPDGEVFAPRGLFLWRKPWCSSTMAGWPASWCWNQWRLTDLDDGHRTGRTWTARAIITDTEPTDPLALTEP